jgi:hypothetical protein
MERGGSYATRVLRLVRHLVYQKRVALLLRGVLRPSVFRCDEISEHEIDRSRLDMY